MEFDIGTLFYILITIIAIVASVVGKKKKPADGQHSSEEEIGPFGFFSKLEEQIGGLVDDSKEGVQQMAEEVSAEVVPAEQRDDNRILQDKDSYDWQSASFDGDTATSGNYYNEFEGFYDSDKQDSLDAIIKEAERTTSDEVIQVIDVEGISHPDYFKIVESFDLGTAVIYSTIINRKEY